ncbi:YfcE family phosphodiesterase [Christensenellaceae bacterium OttesenSCG-928-M15]|nr:YfcE family phosphodiesterase [Christensenellaceae bacterium OttesenSCG-928-M15]
MRIFVFSDSHTDVINMAHIIEKGSPDMVFHLGDHLKDALELIDMYPALPFKCVKGNTDFYGPDTQELFFELLGKRFLLAHGHLYGVKTGLARYKAHAKALGADIALFGHTHIPLLETDGDRIIMNPGRSGRFLNNFSPVSYGVLELEAAGEIKAKIVIAE